MTRLWATTWAVTLPVPWLLGVPLFLWLLLGPQADGWAVVGRTRGIRQS
jgi:cardiolipin synthase